MKAKNKGDFKDEEKGEKEGDEGENVQEEIVEEARKSQLPTKCGRRTGIILQIFLFILNGTAWVIAVLAITGGLIVGFGTQTININFEIADLMVATPATLFITYGFALLIVTAVGCFASASANMFHNICYIVLIILFVVFDLVLGFLMLFSPKSLIKFINHLRGSMNGYGKSNASPVGIFPLPPTFYWDHLQRRGHCCGLYLYKEWRNASIGKETKGIPDSCCNSEYGHRFCGALAWQHPDMKGHNIENIINTRGCLTIFPPTLITSFEEVTYMGLLLGALLLSCLVLTIVIIIITCMRLYDPGQGIANYQLREVAKNIDDLDIEEVKGENRQSRYIFERRRQRKVHPDDGEAGDSNLKGRRKVNFLESGPQLIPSEHFVDSDNEYAFPTAPSVLGPTNDYTDKHPTGLRGKNK